MVRTTCFTLAVLLCVSRASVCVALDAGQTRVAKAATALVIRPGEESTGTAFCVDAAGAFITNDHVVRGLAKDDTVTLVLSPSEVDERVVKARLLAADKERDLALLQAVEATGFTPLPLGTVDGLVETQQLTALGYPFGTALSDAKDRYPSVSINLVRISSLRKSEGVLRVIQIDSQLNPGNSGGPLIDVNGRVVGVVNAGILGGGINFAIPVSEVSAFLSTPRITFSPPTIPDEKRGQPLDLSIGVLSFERSAQPTSVTMILSPGAPDERRVPATRDDSGLYKITVVPVPADKQATLRAMISLTDAVVRSSVEDQTVTLDERTFRLGDLARVERSATDAVVELRDGTEITGRRLSIEPISAQIGGKVVMLDPESVRRIMVFAKTGENQSIAYRIEAMRGGQVIAEQKGDLIGPTASVRRTEPAIDDPIATRLEDVKEDHARSIELIRQRLLDFVSAKAQRAAESGDLKSLKAIESAKASLALDGTLPKDGGDADLRAAVNAALADVRNANVALAEAYEQAVRDYTRARKVAEAESVQAELERKRLTGDSGMFLGGGWTPLGGTNPLPAFLESNPQAFSEGGIGLQFRGDHVIRTKQGNWLNEDFTLDLIYAYQPGARAIAAIGFGEGFGKRNAVHLRIHTPALADGRIGLVPAGQPELHWAFLASDGPHLLRLEKKGEFLTVSVCIDYDGKFTPDVTSAPIDVKTVAPFLNKSNTFIYFGGPGVIYREIRLVKPDRL